MIYDLHNDFLTAKTCIPFEKTTGKLLPKSVIFAVWTTRIKPSAHELFGFHLPDCVRSGIAVEDLGSVSCEENVYKDLLEKLRPVYVSLTWNGENKLGGGCGCESPLTKCGKSAVAILALLDIPLDLAHLSDTAFFSALEESDKRGARVLVTHTASRAISKHPRNLTDAMAKEIAARGGIIGIAAVPDFLDNNLSFGEGCDIKKYADHLEHFCALVGSDHVAIGTDFNGTEQVPDGLSDYDGFAELKNILINRGFNSLETDKIFYVNAERFLH